MCILRLKSGPEHAERPSLLWFPKKVLPGLSAQWSVGTAPKPNIAGKYGTEQNNTAWCSSLWANTCHMHPQKSNINFTKQKHRLCGRRRKLWRKRVSSMLKAQEIICLLFRSIYCKPGKWFWRCQICAHSGSLESILFILLPSYRVFPKKTFNFHSGKKLNAQWGWWKGWGTTYVILIMSCAWFFNHYLI